MAGSKDIQTMYSSSSKMNYCFNFWSDLVDNIYRERYTTEQIKQED